jgi:preprotein translocase subunit SecG
MNQISLFYIQIISMGLAAVLVLIQNRGASLSSSFGGSNEVYLTRKGVEKSVVFLTWFMVFIYTVVTVYGMFAF